MISSTHTVYLFSTLQSILSLSVRLMFVGNYQKSQCNLSEPGWCQVIVQTAGNVYTEYTMLFSSAQTHFACPKEADTLRLLP